MAAGYAAGFTAVLVWLLVTDGNDRYIELALLIVGWFMAMVAIPAWAMAVLPIWLFLRPDSRLWQPWPATGTGAGSGALAITITFVLMNLTGARSNYDGLATFLSIATFSGAATGFIGALLHRR